MKLPIALQPVRLALFFLAVATLTVTGCDSDDPEGTTADVKVMSYNLYLGADIFDLVGAPAEEIPLIAAQLYAGVEATDFPARAEAIAGIIADEDPALVGLQEVTWYRTDPSDGSEAPNASTTTYDFLQILLDELDARDLDYTVVATTTNADVEVPSTTDGQTFTDIRLTDRDVILARNDVSTTSAVEANFDTFAPVPVGGVEIPFLRGYNHVTATVDGVTFTFANAHLEVDDGNPQGAARAQTAQAAELALALNSTRAPVVLVGDFNSPADGSGTVTPDFDTTTYDLLTRTYTDAFDVAGVEGATCCQDGDLLNTTSELSSRIDLILYRGSIETLNAEIVGDERVDLGGPQWPSDHAGVVATLRVEN